MALQKKSHVAPPLVRDPVSNVTVDIIIPFHSQTNKLIESVKSIYRVTRKPEFDICLVDDCSPDEHLYRIFEKAPRLKYVRLPKHLGFGAAVDMGIRSTDNSWICVLHSDCVVSQPRWLEEMLRTMGTLRSRRVMMVSARTDNPGSCAPPALKAKKEDTDEDVVLEEGFLPMYCSLMHRQLFRVVGGYLRTYPYALYEDEELAARMRAKGLSQAVCGKSWVRHEGGATIDFLCKIQNAPGYSGPDYKGIMEANYERCVKDITGLRQQAAKPTTATAAAGRR